MLLALVMAHRTSDLVRLSLVGRTCNPDGVALTCKGLAKQTRPGKEKGLQSVIIASFGEVELYPVAYLRAYEAATEKFRISEGRMQLFLSTIIPHGPVTSSTISRYLKKSLDEADLGCQFTGHSTRSAASTAASLVGVSTQES